MERTTEHQILSPADQETLDRDKIETLLKEHNLAENVDLILELIRACKSKTSSSDKIDLCIEKILREHEEEQKERKLSETEEIEKRFNIYSK